MNHEKIENLHKGIEVINKHQVEIVELKNIIKEKTLLDSLSSRMEKKKIESVNLRTDQWNYPISIDRRLTEKKLNRHSGVCGAIL